MDYIRFKEINDNRQNFGELTNPTIFSVYKNSVCGDNYKLYLNLENGKIVDATYISTGCGFSIVALETLIDLIKNKTIEEARNLKPENIESVFEFPPRKKYYPEFVISALNNALDEIV